MPVATQLDTIDQREAIGQRETIDQLLAMATDPTAPARKRISAARAVLDALHPKPTKAPRKPVAPTRSPVELQAALDALRARREQLERP